MGNSHRECHEKHHSKFSQSLLRPWKGVRVTESVMNTMTHYFTVPRYLENESRSLTVVWTIQVWLIIFSKSRVTFRRGSQSMRVVWGKLDRTRRSSLLNIKSWLKSHVHDPVHTNNKNHTTFEFDWTRTSPGKKTTTTNCCHFHLSDAAVTLRFNQGHCYWYEVLVPTKITTVSSLRQNE